MGANTSGADISEEFAPTAEPVEGLDPSAIFARLEEIDSEMREKKDAATKAARIKADELAEQYGGDKTITFLHLLFPQIKSRLESYEENDLGRALKPIEDKDLEGISAATGNINAVVLAARVHRKNFCIKIKGIQVDIHPNSNPEERIAYYQTLRQNKK